jgi:biotin synthase
MMTYCRWNEQKCLDLLEQPFFELIHQAYTVHTQHFRAGDMEFCTLANIKTGACPEDCAYCPQSAHYNTGLKKEKLMDIASVVAAARGAKMNGAKRFCMGAAWRKPSQKDLPRVVAMIRAVKDLGLETCVTLGMLEAEDALLLKESGLDFYNHNVDSSAEFYSSIIQTHTYEDRLDTLKQVMAVGINVCSGGILGMGETRADRIKMLLTLYELAIAPKSIPINQLIPIPGTPLAEASPLDPFELIKIIALTRILFPETRIRLSAGRENMTDETQAWCFMAGANSIFIGDKLLTAKNPRLEHDRILLKKLNMQIPETIHA